MSSQDHPDWWRPTGGQNSQDSILERRSLIWNDNGVVAPAAPPANYTDIDYKGKFYARGCRGKIEAVQIYCIRTGAGFMTLRLSPHPSLGPFQELTITPGATWAWVTRGLEQMWDYDSLFIWISYISLDVSWGYDAVQPYDGHESDNAGATWGDLAIRPFIRVVYTAETPGDVPISGIINNIKIPNTSSEKVISAYLYNTPPAAETLIDLHGAGYCDSVIWSPAAFPGSHTFNLLIYCDEELAWNYTPQEVFDMGFMTASPSLSLNQYVVDGICTISLTKLFEFKRRFRLAVQCAFGGGGFLHIHPTLLS